jgi:hypothetical protein
MVTEKEIQKTYEIAAKTAKTRRQHRMGEHYLMLAASQHGMGCDTP